MKEQSAILHRLGRFAAVIVCKIMIDEDADQYSMPVVHLHSGRISKSLIWCVLAAIGMLDTNRFPVQVVDHSRAVDRAIDGDTIVIDTTTNIPSGLTMLSVCLCYVSVPEPYVNAVPLASAWKWVEVALRASRMLSVLRALDRGSTDGLFSARIE